MDITSYINVLREDESSWRLYSARSPDSTLRMVRICLSQMPPMWLAEGGFILKSQLCSSKTAATLSLSISFMASAIHVLLRWSLTLGHILSFGSALWWLYNISSHSERSLWTCRLSPLYGRLLTLSLLRLTQAPYWRRWHKQKFQKCHFRWKRLRQTKFTAKFVYVSWFFFCLLC